MKIFSSFAFLSLFFVLTNGAFAQVLSDQNRASPQPNSPEKNALSDQILRDPVTRIVIAAGIPVDQQARLYADLQYLARIDGRAREAEIEKTLGLSEISAKSLSAWLRDRVAYIVGETFKTDSIEELKEERFEYPNPGLFPTAEGNAKASSLHAVERSMFNSKSTQEQEKSNPKTVVIMQNLGASIYINAKKWNITLGIHIPGADVAIVRSPRVGVIRIGEGLFRTFVSRYGVKSKNLDDEPYKIARLVTLFHEARHSDGNGKTMGFFHAVCPEGHDFAGSKACDRSVNGAYTIEALTVKALLSQCGSCSVADREALKLKIVANYGRVLEGATFWDASPEGKR